MKCKRVIIGVGIGCLLALGPVTAETRRTRSSTGTDATNFDLPLTTGETSETPRRRAPAGWVGPLPSEREKAPPAPTAVPGGGTGDGYSTAEGIIVVHAVPPPGVELEEKRAAPLPKESEAAAEAPAPKEQKLKKSSSSSSSKGERAQLPESVHLPGGGTLDLAPLRGMVRHSYTDEDMVPIYVRYGSSTSIELPLEYLPIVDVTCGFCVNPGGDGGQAPFWVDWKESRVVIHPLEPTKVGGDDCLRSPDECGIVMTDLGIETSRGVLTFEVWEVSGLLDAVGRPLRRSGKHVVLRREREAPPATQEVHREVSRVAKDLRRQYEVELSEAGERLLEEKARQRYEAYTDLRVEKKSKGRSIEILSCVSIGDRLLVKLRVPGELPLGRPVVVVERGLQLTLLSPKGDIATENQVVDGEKVIIYTIAVEGYALAPGERIAVSIRDLEHDREMRASAGRGEA